MGQAKIKRIIFIAISVILCAAFLLFLYPFFYENISESSTDKLYFSPKINPGLSDYLAVSIETINTGSVKFPKGTASIAWGQDGSLYIEKFDMHIDGMLHNYYIPIGENQYWLKTGNVEKIEVSLPEVDNIEIGVKNISFNRRIFFPVDSAVKLFFKKTFSISSINRFLAPAALIFIFISLLSLLYFIIFKEIKSKINPVVISAVAILLFFSCYFIQEQYNTVKSYFSSYYKEIKEKDFSSTYFGFYDFEKFLSWLNFKMPDGQNLIMLVRGEPVYIMSEAAYNLYPRDIKFINISQKEDQEIIEEIEEINKENNYNYRHIVILSDKDSLQSYKLTLVDNYRETGGYIYTINGE